VKSVNLTSDEGTFVSVRADPERDRLGKRLRGDLGKVAKAIKELSHDKIRAFQADGKIEIEGHTLTSEDLKVIREFKGDQKRYEAAWSENVLVVLDCHIDDSLKSEGLAREVVNRVQKLRKKAGLQPGETVEAFFSVNESQQDGAFLVKAINQSRAHIFEATKLHLLNASLKTNPSSVILHEKAEVEGVQIDLYLTNCSFSFDDEALKKKFGEAAEDVKTAVVSRDYFKFRHTFENGVSSFTLNSKLVQLKLGEDVFMSAYEKLEHSHKK